MKPSAKEEKELREHAINRLKELMPPDTIVTKLVTHVAPSGLSRSIRCLIVHHDQIFDFSGFVARACGLRFDDKNCGVRINGAGMCIGYELVSILSYKLYGADDKLKQRWI
jgi:hypothetical protein